MSERAFNMLANINYKAFYNLPYLVWLVFYYVLFSLIFGGNQKSFLVMGMIYAVCIFLSLTLGEVIYRQKLGLREPQTQAELDYLMPIFESVYEEARQISPNISRRVKLYIYDSMEINAFAFGRNTLAVTKGCIQLLNERALYGIMAHEFGHFSTHDTESLIIASIGNTTLNLFVRFINFNMRIVAGIWANEDRTFVVRMIIGFFTICYKAIIFIGDIILMPVSRGGEYRADKFAFDCGYGEELCYALQNFQILETSPAKFFDRVLSTHPTTASRIARLEGYLNQYLQG